ncbi:Bug family tripartite tricarboxylate transporter substrate binding protein [Propylenella binzhouense]|uniref:Tripartite-type tricarboxylate transporter receptor subunit TctC n=1 Tax=Propylenella binzhouense TaxID=2555902 RepID=A0A964T7H0_9HYPH|nr:tripartite tricarboxylate transporter substrate-binding protein [Propylenella binzhouense]MYZ49495.1 hypothetical protein [Propylenella binzhouense]
MKESQPYRIAGLALAVAIGLTGHALAEDFYAGKRVIMIVGAPPDGSYATYSRTLANHLPKHIPGNPTIELEYRGGGGGGLDTANYMDNAAPQDGTAFGITQQTIPVNQFIRPKSGRYDVTKWQWVGGIAPVRNMLALWHACPVQSIEDAKKEATKVGATAKSSPMFIVPQMMNHFLGTKFDIVLGYDGVAATNLAMEQGEICGRGASWVSVLSGAPHYAEKKLLKPIVVDGAKRDPALPDVPTLLELAQTDEQRQAFQVVAASATFGRSYFFPAGAPKEAVETMRKAFEETMKDPDFLAEAKAQKISVEPVSAEELQQAVEELTKIPPETLQAIGKVMAGS